MDISPMNFQASNAMAKQIRTRLENCIRITEKNSYDKTIKNPA